MPKRGENIYKRKDGRWEGRYIRGRSPSGGAVYGYVYACSYRECRVKRQKQLEALGDAPEQAASLTLAQAAGRFLADREKQLKESTRARYAYLLRHYILPGLGETSVGQLTANGISDFLGGLQRGGLSGKSARDVGVLLKSVLKYSVRRLECSCPGLEAELPVYRRKQVSVFSADEVQRLARWVLSAPDGTGVAVLLALNTGLRLGELCALLGIDRVIAVGEYARGIADAAHESAEWYPDAESAVDAARAAFTEGSVLLCKASHSMHLEKIVEELLKTT